MNGPDTDLPDTGQALTSYSEAAMPLSVTRTVKITSAINAVAPTDVDGLGRVTQSRLTSDPQGTVFTDTTYDARGQKKTVTNPYRSTSDPTYGITTFEYDALGRVIKVIPPDGSGSANHVSSTYSGNCTTVTDQAGKKRKSCTDALGRLIEVWEPDASGAFVNQTVYTYDVLDNLLTVVQSGSRNRTFVYNSLSQLTSVTNPESGTVTYTYDNDGNLLTKTAPKPNQTGSLTVTTTYTYDALHRLTGKTYNDGSTPAVSYFYDQTSYNGLTITNGIGRRTGMSDAAGAEAWSYDVVGRVLTNRRTTNGVTKTFSYTYNLDGSLATLTYPSGRVVTYTPNSAGQTVSAVSSDAINYATDAKYGPHGALCSVKNSGGTYTSTFTFNNRLQPLRLHATTTGAPATPCDAPTQTATLLDFGYGFNHGASNNGNVASIANNLNTGRTQTFTYDELNRIQTAQSQAASGTYAWGQSYVFLVPRRSGAVCDSDTMLFSLSIVCPVFVQCNVFVMLEPKNGVKLRKTGAS